jgi:translation initiation factor 4A
MEENKILTDDDFGNEFENWEDLDIHPNILRGIFSYGFEKPSTIQKKSIIPIMNGRDIIAQSQSGTGKSGSFIIGALSKINLNQNTTQVLIFAPTRELTTQIASVIQGISGMMNNLRICTLFGGSNIDANISILKNNPHIIIACPGRFYDLLQRGYVITKNINLVVLDEADEMFSFGFKDIMYEIFSLLNNDIQIALFSATLPESINYIVDKIMKNPIKIIVTADLLTLEGIKQYFIAVENDKQKFLVIKDLYSIVSVSQCIIYCNNINRVESLYSSMLEDGFPVCQIHGNLDKKTRECSLNDFKNGKFRVLISSGLTSRGIDIQQVSIVINFDVPKCKHSYLHHVGRVGRYGRKGIAINIITKYDIQKLKELEAFYNCQIDELPINFENYIYK